MEKLYYNGDIITMTERDTEAEAVLIKDGIIRKVGRLNSLLQFTSENTKKIDLQGRCLMPSFIDSHSHIVMNGQTAAFADLSDCENFQDIIQVLKKYAEDNGITDDGAVIGYGYDHNFLQEKRHPDKRELDAVSKEIPVMIVHISAHLACVNSAMLKLAEIDENAKDPEGGLIGRIDERGEPSGYLEETALGAVWKVINSRAVFDAGKMMEKMQDIYIKHGITTVQDGASANANMELLSQMADEGKLQIDVAAYPVIAEDGAEIINRFKKYDRNYRNHLKIGGYKIILDGSPQGRTAWMTKPYLGGNQKECGYAYWDNDTVKGYVEQSVREKRQLLAHCNGDAASEQFLKAYEDLGADDNNISELRPVMIHCQTVRNDQLERMAKIHMIASFFVGHVWYWGDIHLKNFGPERGNYISPVRDAVDKGVIATFHQDTPVTKPDMLHSVWCAVNRISRNGTIIGKEQRATVYEALKAVTIHGAYQYFEEDTKGSIEEGKRADLIILSQSPLKVDPIKIKEIQVLETIKDGETIYKA